MPTRPLIHIGYHKTATTWMQRQLFVPAHGYHQIATHEDVFEYMVEPHGLVFSPSSIQERIAAAYTSMAEDQVPVISSEILSGHPFFGGRESDIYAARLAQIAPDARILVSIRAQMKILPSVYMQYLLRGGTMRYTDFFSGENPLGFFRFSPDHFKYDRLIGLYQSLFGAENVHVLTQESLYADMEKTARDIAAFCDNSLFEKVQNTQQRENASYPENAAHWLRRVNHFKKNVLNPTPTLNLGGGGDFLFRAVGAGFRSELSKKLLGSPRPVSQFVAENFDGYYDNSNTRLAAVLGNRVDLSKYS